MEKENITILNERFAPIINELNNHLCGLAAEVINGGYPGGKVSLSIDVAADERGINEFKYKVRANVKKQYEASGAIKLNEERITAEDGNLTLISGAQLNFLKGFGLDAPE